MNLKSVIASTVLCTGLVISVAAVNAAELRIGTTSQGGAFYPVGQAISSLVNNHGADCNRRLSSKSPTYEFR